MEQAALISSLVSTILAGVAIFLSIFFYKMADKIAQSTKDVSITISSVVERLEILFNTFYTDTFGMMKDTYADMRKQVWFRESGYSSDLAEEKTEEKLKHLKEEMKAELASILSKLDKTDIKVDWVQGKIDSIINKTVDESAKAERSTRDEFIVNDALTILEIISRVHDSVPAKEFIKPFASKHGHSEAFRILREFREKGLLDFRLSDDSALYNDSIKIDLGALRSELKKRK